MKPNVACGVRCGVLGFLRQPNLRLLDLANRLKRAVGFRNLAVHNYDAIDWGIVHDICRHHLDDFREYAAFIVKQLPS